MKKLLFHLDTDLHLSTFDTVAAYNGGADHVISHGNATPKNMISLVGGVTFA